MLHKSRIKANCDGGDGGDGDGAALSQNGTVSFPRKLGEETLDTVKITSHPLFPGGNPQFFQCRGVPADDSGTKALARSF